MKLFVGLGNPGTKYARHRHNVGFMAVEAVARAHGFGPWKPRFQGRTSEGTLDGTRVVLLEPETYMNDSGRAVGEAVRYLKVDIGDVVVFHDELDLAPGKVRVKTGGGNAGHNGLRSITALVGNETVRVRIGIGHPGVKELVQQWVLHDFAKADAAWLTPLLDAMAAAAPHLAGGDGERFMTEVARLTQPEPPRKAAEPAADAGTRPAAKGPVPGDEKPAAAGPLAEKLKNWLKGPKT